MIPFEIYENGSIHLAYVAESSMFQEIFFEAVDPVLYQG